MDLSVLVQGGITLVVGVILMALQMQLTERSKKQKELEDVIRQQGNDILKLQVELVNEKRAREIAEEVVVPLRERLNEISQNTKEVLKVVNDLTLSLIEKNKAK